MGKKELLRKIKPDGKRTILNMLQGVGSGLLYGQGHLANQEETSKGKKNAHKVAATKSATNQKEIWDGTGSSARTPRSLPADENSG